MTTDTPSMADMVGLMQKLDMKAIARLSRHVDLPQLVEALGAMDPRDVARMLQRIGTPDNKPAPPVNGDFYEIAETLTEDEQTQLRLIRAFMETEVRPISAEYWERGEFPKDILPGFAKLIGETLGMDEFRFPTPNPLLFGASLMEMARVDAAISTFFGVHWGLCMGSIVAFGSDEQKERFLPAMKRFEKIGSWALTEPEVGSATAAGLTTTALREGDTWIINGQKKWSGNATFADVNIIWARDMADNQVKGFIVEQGTPGYTVEKLQGKMALRSVENVLITLTDVRVAEADRLPGVQSFRDVGRQLAAARAGVGWKMTGVAMGAYERSLEYANSRVQFGKPIANFQLVQNMLVQMLANLTAMQTMLLRLAQLEARDGTVSQERASLAKVFCGEKMREVVAQARGLFGGNGILLEYEVGRYFADAEALYSYEGTHEMNTLIVGRAITGKSAFV